MVYLIQDYEPGFWPWSSEYLLAESTYRALNPVVAVFSSSILRDYFRGQNYTFFKEYSFEPKLNSVLRATISWTGLRPRRSGRSCSTGVPGPRNAFSVAEAGLRAWRARFPDAHRGASSRWGSRTRISTSMAGSSSKSVGKASLERYAQVVLESSIGISLMVSPHPSFPPLEMVHFGLMTITNRFANKDLSLLHDNFISIDDARPESIADQLVTLCRRFESDPASGYRGASRMPHYLDDTPSSHSRTNWPATSAPLALAYDMGRVNRPISHRHPARPGFPRVSSRSARARFLPRRTAG